MHCFIGDFFINSTDFEKNHTWLYNCCPEFRSTFTLTHACFSRFLGDWFIREYTCPHLAFAVDAAVDSNTSCLNVFSIEPYWFHSYERYVSKVDVVVTGCKTFLSTALYFAVDYSFRTKHFLLFSFSFCSTGSSFFTIAICTVVTRFLDSNLSCIFLCFVTIIHSVVYPNLYANLAVSGQSNFRTIVNVCAERMERNTSFLMLFSTFHFCATKTTCETDFYTLCSSLHGIARSLFESLAV